MEINNEFQEKENRIVLSRVEIVWLGLALKIVSQKDRPLNTAFVGP